MSNSEVHKTSQNQFLNSFKKRIQTFFVKTKYNKKVTKDTVSSHVKESEHLRWL